MLMLQSSQSLQENLLQRIRSGYEVWIESLEDIDTTKDSERHIGMCEKDM